MKQKLIAILFVLYLILASPLVAAGLEPLWRFVDNADLLTSSERSTLDTRMTHILYAYDMDVVILTVDTLDGKSATAYADDYYDYSGYGIDRKHSGLLLLIAMDEWECAVNTCGDAIRAVTDDEIDYIISNISGKLSAGAYYEAFDAFLDQIEAEYQAFTDENTLDAGDIILRIVIALVIGAAIAGIALLIMRSKMNTAKQQSGAVSYMVNSSYDLYRCQDIFLYSKTTKSPKAQNTSSNSTHRSSSGRSHGGRSGRF